jgi:hypothetical protein
VGAPDTVRADPHSQFEYDGRRVQVFEAPESYNCSTICSRCSSCSPPTPRCLVSVRERFNGAEDAQGPPIRTRSSIPSRLIASYTAASSQPGQGLASLRRARMADLAATRRQGYRVLSLCASRSADLQSARVTHDLMTPSAARGGTITEMDVLLGAESPSSDLMTERPSSVSALGLMG